MFTQDNTKVEEAVAEDKVAEAEETPVEPDVENILNCPDCNGTGLESDTQRCPTCDGTGKVA